MNSPVAAVDLSNTEGITTLRSPYGDVTETLPIHPDDLGFAQFADRTPKYAMVAFEATGMSYPVYRALASYGYDAKVVQPKSLHGLPEARRTILHTFRWCG